MTDLEACRLCAEAMGIDLEALGPGLHGCVARDGRAIPYDPLTDDAQAMALVKRFGAHIEGGYTWQAGIPNEIQWEVEINNGEDQAWIRKDANLNRAIVMCVAAMNIDGPTSKGGL